MVNRFSPESAWTPWPWSSRVPCPPRCSLLGYKLYSSWSNRLSSPRVCASARLYQSRDPASVDRRNLSRIGENAVDQFGWRYVKRWVVRDRCFGADPLFANAGHLRWRALLDWNPASLRKREIEGGQVRSNVKRKTIVLRIHRAVIGA